MAAFFSDTFTEASDTDLASHTPTLGTSWTQVINVGTNLAILASSDTLSAVAADGGLSDGALYTADVTYPSADYEAQVTVVTADTGDDKCVLAVRVQDANNMYAVQFNGTNSGTGTDRNIMYKRVAGTWTAVGSSFAAVADGSVVKLQIIGTALKFFDDGVEVASATVSDHSAAGKAGIGMGAVIVSGCDMDTQAMDSFSVTDLGTVTPTISKTENVTVSESKTVFIPFFAVRVSESISVSEGTGAMASGVTAAWHLDETSGTREDSAGSSDLADNNTVTQSTGVLGNDAFFTAANSEFLSVADNAALGFTTALSISFWVKQTTLGTNRAMIGKWTYQTDGEFAIQTGWADPNEITMYIATSAADSGTGCRVTFGNVDIGLQMDEDIWYHIAIIYDGTQTGDANRLKLYQDGVLKDSNTVTGAVPASMIDGGADFFLGKFGGSLTRYFDGELDEVVLWNRAITEAEVDLLYNGGAGLAYPYSGGGVNVEVVGGGSTDVNISVSDTVTVTESVTKMVQSFKSVSDTVTVSESQTLLPVSFVSATDTVTVSETVAQTLAYNVSVAETVTITETVARLATNFISATQSVTVSETVTPLGVALVSATDTVTVTEAINLLSVALVNASDTVTVTEAQTILVPELYVSSTDTVTVTETVTKLVVNFVSATDTVTVSEAVNNLVTSFVSVSDTITVTEATDQVVVDSDTGINVSDTVTITEAVKLLEESYIAATDTVTVTEATGQVVVSFVSASDSITVSEATNQIVTSFISVTDTVTVTEAITLLVPELYTASVDTVTVTEAIKNLVESYVSATDTVTVSEVTNQVVESYITATDTVSISETIIVTSVNYINISEPVTVTDIANLFHDGALRVDVSESITVTDTPNASIYLPDLLINVRELIGPYKFIFVDGQLAMRITGKFYTLL